MDFFSNKRVYGGKWSVESIRKFTPEEMKKVKKTIIVDSQYGTSACFMMVNGTTVYSPLSIDSTAQVGDEIDLNSAEILTLVKDGKTPIERLRC